MRLDSAGPPGNPLEAADLPDDLALAIIRNYAEDIAYERVDERNRLRMRVKLRSFQGSHANELQ